MHYSISFIYSEIHNTIELSSLLSIWGGGGIQRPLIISARLTRRNHTVYIMCGDWGCFPVQTPRYWATVGSMLDHRLRRWPSIELTMAECFLSGSTQPVTQSPNNATKLMDCLCWWLYIISAKRCPNVAPTAETLARRWGNIWPSMRWMIDSCPCSCGLDLTPGPPGQVHNFLHLVTVNKWCSSREVRGWLSQDWGGGRGWGCCAHILRPSPCIPDLCYCSIKIPLHKNLWQC